MICETLRTKLTIEKHDPPPFPQITMDERKGPGSDSAEFAKLQMGLVVLVKIMSVLINFLLQNTNLVSVLIKICPNFAGHISQD